MIKLWAGDPNSVVDHENGLIFLRSGNYPRGRLSVEWIISETKIIINHANVRTKSEEIQISDIFKMTLKVGIKMTSVTLELEGRSPKKWFRGVHSNGVDVFVAYATCEYILNRRQGDLLNPIEAKIPSHIVEMTKMLRAGQLPAEDIAAFKARGMSW